MNTESICPECSAPLPPDAPAGLCPRCLLKSAAGLGTAQTVVTSGDLPEITDPADVAARLPQYEILKLLGKGGMGVVYKARQRHLDRVVALKILPPGDALSPDFVERFRREAQALAKLSHPNIVAVHDFGESGGLYFFAMEFVDGANLREVLRAKRFTPAEALAIVPRICDALQYAHEEGVVHRDIKPENLLIDARGRVKIADFGLAKLLRRETADHTLTMTGMTLGTPRYMAPEQLDKPETVDHRADIYSLGVVFYEMLTGEVPMGRFAPPSEKVQVDVKLDEIVLRSLERDVERRYQHASEVKTDVERVTGKPSAPFPAATTGGATSAIPNGKPVPQPLASTPVPADADPKRQMQIKARGVEMMIAGLALAISGIIGFIYGMVVAADYASKVTNPADNVASRAAFGALLFIPVFLCGIAAFVASLGMRKLCWHPFALVMSILLMLALPGVVIANHAPPPQLIIFQLGYAFYAGLRTFLLLRKPETEATFAAAPRFGPSGRPPGGMLPAMMIFAGVLTILSAVLTALLVTGVFVDRSHFDAFFRRDSVTITLLVMQTLALPCGVLMLLGGANAAASPGIALTAAKLAFVPLTPAWLFTMPLGISALSQLPCAAREPKPVADEPRKSVLASASPLGLASLVATIAALGAHKLQWQSLIVPGNEVLSPANSLVISCKVSVVMLVLAVVCAMFASVPRLAVVAKRIVRAIAGLFVLAALWYQVSFLLTLGKWEPGQTGKVLRMTQSYAEFGLYATIGLTALALLVFVLRFVEEMSTGKSIASDDEPRLSKCALIGVLWEPWTLAGWWAWQHCIRQYFDRPEMFATYPAHYVILGVTVGILAGTAPLGSMLLGGVAIAQIKLSKGKLYGLPMAACALLAHPLAALGALTLFCTHGVANYLADFFTPPPSPDGPPPHAGIGAMYLVPVALAVMFFVGRAAWRKISGATPQPKAPRAPGARTPLEITAASTTALAFLTGAVNALIGLAQKGHPLGSITLVALSAGAACVAVLLVKQQFQPPGTPWRAALPELAFPALAACAGPLPWTWVFGDVSGLFFWHGAAFSALNFLVAIFLLVTAGARLARTRAIVVLLTGLAGLALVLWWNAVPVTMIGDTGGSFGSGSGPMTIWRKPALPAVWLSAALAVLTAIAGALRLRAALGSRSGTAAPGPE